MRNAVATSKIMSVSPTNRTGGGGNFALGGHQYGTKVSFVDQVAASNGAANFSGQVKLKEPRISNLKNAMMNSAVQ